MGECVECSFKSPTLSNLLDISEALSMDQQIFLQIDLSELGGQYVHQRRKLQVGSRISIQIHSTFTGSRSVRLRTLSEFDMFLPPKLFLPLREITLETDK